MTPWTVAHQASLSMELARQEYLSGLTFPSPGDLPNPGIKPKFPALQANSMENLTWILDRKLTLKMTPLPQQ